MQEREINIGLAGFGTVGRGVVELLTRYRDAFKKKVGAALNLVHVASRSIHSVTEGLPPDIRVSTDPLQLARDENIDLILELIGGTETAKSLVLAALSSGRAVVTANKALLALHGGEIFAMSEKEQAPLGFEASVAGGVPIVRTLRQGFGADANKALFGIVNGTCNYVLSTMSEEDEDFDTVLSRAQELGYAEADPSMDVDGLDAAQKLTLLVMLAFGVRVPVESVYTEGIRGLNNIDIALAREFGYVIKLLAIAKEESGALEARVHPTMIPQESILAGVNGPYNAVLTQGEALGSSLQFGQGAGALPTAAAVLSDVIEIARSSVTNRCYQRPLGYAWADLRDAALRSMDQLVGEYYLRFMAIDRPGVLTQISGILGDQNISIASVIQRGRGGGDKAVPLVMRTHAASESNLKAAVRLVNQLPIVNGKCMCIRIEDRLG